MPAFSEILYWHDVTARPGEQNMAVDQALLETSSSTPILRIYSWSEPCVSFGYFLPLADVVASFQDKELNYIRRWTGGGMVDHRHDLTYTVVIPRAHPLATARGAESYRVIHHAVVQALRHLGSPSQLVPQTDTSGTKTGQDCFTNPVAYDVVGEGGKKLAGAGQRRTRHGLLHQGSVQCDALLENLGDALCANLTSKITDFSPEPSFFSNVNQLTQSRYASESWKTKR